jgi:hypothetical protein
MSDVRRQDLFKQDDIVGQDKSARTQKQFEKLQNGEIKILRGIMGRRTTIE